MNSKTPTRSSLHETDKYAMEDFAERIELLTGVLGRPMFVSLSNASAQVAAVADSSTVDELIFQMQVPKSTLSAQLRRTDEGYVVLAGSYARKEIVASASDTLVTLRKRLLADGTLVEADGELRFQRDTLLSSPSSAAVLVNGRSTNGWDAWTSSKGTLSEVLRFCAG